MKKAISVNRKTRGRPKKKGGVHPVTAVRLSPDVGAAVDQWLKWQQDPMTRSEAMRRLVELGLTVKSKAKQPSATRADRAKELAAEAISMMIDPATLPEERAHRRRRLTKGPTEFRQDRVDLPKAKK